MSWAIGYDHNWERDIGYGVPAFCDHPGCSAKIDRGLSHVCGGEPYGGEKGCGLYFCPDHLAVLCARCDENEDPFSKSEEHPEWLRHKLTHDSWQTWRDEHPTQVAALQAKLEEPAHAL